jgi:serine/threonine-protein kinase HipA
MTSKASGSLPSAIKNLFVWTWLPGALDPVVVGVLTPTQQKVAGEIALSFTYAKSYQLLPEAISLFPAELPLQNEPLDPSNPLPGRSALALHGAIRDCAPDAWGRRIINQRLGVDSKIYLDEITYLANSGGNRIGALDFQNSSKMYVPRGEAATLEQLLNAAEYIEAGTDLPEELRAAAEHGTSIGGATPKALLSDGRKELIAKFSSSTDDRPVIQAEDVATFIAAQVGIQVANSEIRTVSGKKVLLLERFDRTTTGSRKQMLSALTILGKSEFESRYSSYSEIADAIRLGPWAQVSKTLRELFNRLVFNVCIGNTDDHLRNHAAFWDGSVLLLTPAFDLTPQRRSGETATHAIAITGDGRRESQLQNCLTAAPAFGLTETEAKEMIDHVLFTIRQSWKAATDHAQLGKRDAEMLWGREFLNPYIFYNY